MASSINSLSFTGIDIVDIDVQVHFAPGFPSFTLVGLPDKTVAESKERIRAAIHSIGLSLPAERITVNLSPADLMKEGSHFDLPIALGILANLGLIHAELLKDYLILGELALDNKLLGVNGILPAAIGANARNKGLICPKVNGSEAAWSGNKNIIAARSLLQLLNHFKETEIIEPPTITEITGELNNQLDMQDVKGQVFAKRAFEIAASGGHNILLCGSPGSGKSMLASRLSSILPPLNSQEVLECSMVASIAGKIKDNQLVVNRPFRAPHHSCSMPAMVGGGHGRKVLPGEISLAHNGVLFLDELPEFSRVVIDSLRQPLEEKIINISRASFHASYPADFQLVAAMNPCRCGFMGNKERECHKAPRCGVDYQSKISGPFLDRIDMYLEINAPKIDEMINQAQGESSKAIALRVAKARAIQEKRYQGTLIKNNSQLQGKYLKDLIKISSEAEQLLNQAAEKLNLSMRSYNRVLKLAQTIADLKNSSKIEKSHLSEALSYRKI